MEGTPGGFRIDELDPEPEPGLDTSPATNQRQFHFPILTFAALFGLIAAVAAILNANVLGSEADISTSGPGNWKISTILIAAIASAWFAGLAYLALAVLRRARSLERLHTSITAWLAAFATGPFLLVLYLYAISVAQSVNTRLAVFAIPGAVLLVLIFGQRRHQLTAERMLVSFFIWIAILIVPTFWRDAVNLQMSDFLFGLLNAAGLG